MSLLRETFGPNFTIEYTLNDLSQITCTWDYLTAAGLAHISRRPAPLLHTRSTLASPAIIVRSRTRLLYYI